MAKKKKQSNLKLIFKGVYFILKKSAQGVYWVFKKIPEKNKQRRVSEKKKSISSNFKHEAFGLVDSKSGELKTFEDFLANKKSTIGIILGARGTGKSAIGMRILENLYSQNKRKCYAMGFKNEDLPNWITAVEGVEEISNNSIVLIDEGGILFSSRNAMKNANKVLSELLLISRHKDLQILFISQNSSNLELNAIRQADYLVLKPSSLLQKDFERKKIKDIYTETEEDFKNYKDLLGVTYIYSDKFTGFVTNSLPSFWSGSLSKSFRKK